MIFNYKYLDSMSLPLIFFAMLYGDIYFTPAQKYNSVTTSEQKNKIKTDCS